jgi:hypothetical protein
VKCDSCGKQIDDEFIVCPFCGADVGVAARDEMLAHPVHPDVYPLLAQANLLRTRGDLRGAREKCVEALRRRPNDFEAQVMLGELHEVEGSYDDALSWYKMALDLRPEDETLRQRIEALEAEQSRIARDGAAAAEGPPKHPARLRAAISVAGLVVVVAGMVVIPILAVHRGWSRAQDTAQPAGAPLVTDSAPQTPLNQEPARPEARPDVQPASPAPGMGGITAEEQALARGIQQALGSYGIFQVAQVAVDPRDGSVAVRLAAALQGDPAAERDRIGRAAARAALQVLAREPRCMTVSVQVAVRWPRDSDASVGFVGEMHRGQSDFAEIWHGPALGGG